MIKTGVWFNRDIRILLSYTKGSMQGTVEQNVIKDVALSIKPISGFSFASH